ncbi:MAG: pentapeptide repeat-containing protein [Alphaproteobacteria bacterium]|nr:hypothetical protein [Rhodospirillaceae bacterium]MDP6020396.1 pentapeptide repeat-containing protein [Alphaproteobacteria bacterium]MDP6254083.1 pentapeptide repeat-containing protein [Alphaproteobacteria bacterium]MDP7052778.1 pentapeptide repeat-containing protein [Alphaproteobacteria bacterium]MDP7229896.1 pentapeptide repeat-containing protein [Alphaproteobacteria bacterium]
MAALRAAEAETNEQNRPQLIEYLCQVRCYSGDNLPSSLLTEANLIEADLSLANLRGTDLTRSIISPECLHQAINWEVPK